MYHLFKMSEEGKPVYIGRFPFRVALKIADNRCYALSDTIKPSLVALAVTMWAQTTGE